MLPGTGWKTTSTKISSGRWPGRATCIAILRATRASPVSPAGVEQLSEFLVHQFGQALCKRRSGQVALADEVDERRVDHREAVILALDQGHESRSLLEHLPETRALPNISDSLFQHFVPMWQRTRCQSRIAFIAPSLLLCALAHSDAGMQTFFGIRDPVSVYLQTGLSASGTACPVTVIGGWAGGGGA